MLYWRLVCVFVFVYSIHFKFIAENCISFNFNCTQYTWRKRVWERRSETISLPLFILFSIQVVNRLPIGNSLFWCITFADMLSPNSERICAMWYKQTCSSSKYTNFQRIIIYLGTWRFMCMYIRNEHQITAATTFEHYDCCWRVDWNDKVRHDDDENLYHSSVQAELCLKTKKKISRSNHKKKEDFRQFFNALFPHI